MRYKFGSMKSRLRFAVGRWICALALTICAAIAVPPTSSAQTKCVSPIMTCGCTITKSGFFLIGANLSSTQGLTAKGGCIDVSASQVVLSAGIEGDGGFNITGPGGVSPAGIGVHVLPGANNNLLELPSNIEGWDTGVEIDSNNNIAQDFRANLNGTAGVIVRKAANNVVSSFSASGNSNLGLWITGGASNQVRGATLNGNTVGVLVGCNPLGIVGRSCAPMSTSNRISNLNVGLNSYIGVIIDFGNSQNIVNGVSSMKNQLFDLFDANPNCGQNLWFFNFFFNSNEDCIQ